MTTHDVSRRSLIASFVAILSLALSAWGQGTYTAQLRGVVRDKSGAMIPGAKLVVTEDATNVSHPVTTDEAGHYIFVSLRPSTYTLRVEVPGFVPVVSRGSQRDDAFHADHDDRRPEFRSQSSY